MCILLGFITVKRVNFLNLDLLIVLTVGLSFFRYTSKMLLAAIDENHRGTYDFLYLPIDFKASLLWTSDAFFRNSQVDLKKVNSNVEPKTEFMYFSVQNKCNVGYAFINMVSPSHIIPFYEVHFSIILKGFVIIIVIKSSFE